MTRTFSDGHPKNLPACNFLSQYYFYNIFLQKSCRFSLQTLTKFEAAKTGSGVRFLRLTAVCLRSSIPFQFRSEVFFCSPTPRKHLLCRLLIKGFVCKRFLRSPPPPSYFCSRLIFRAGKTPKTPFLHSSFFAPRKRLLCRL